MNLKRIDMKKLYLLFLLLVLGVGLNAQRYLEPLFPEVDVQRDIPYYVNISVLTGMPQPDTLVFDVYQPIGDTVSNRPVILYFSTGSFLPPILNGTTTGSRQDYTIQRFANIAASMGWVVMVPSYRFGWNPTAATQPERAKGLLEAAYRGIQDGRTFVRFLHQDVQNNGNTYNIDPERIAVFGQGTGGYISLAMATLDRMEEIQLDKYLDPLTGDMLIDTNLLGDLYGERETPLNQPSYVGFSSEIQFAFNAAGAMGDTFWMDENSKPIATAHSLTNLFAPSGINFDTPGDITSGSLIYNGPVVVPTTGEFVTTVAGGAAIMEVANRIGINDIILDNPLIDENPLTQELMTRPYADDNYWSIVQDFPEIRVGLWEWWDESFWGTLPHPTCGATMPPDCSYHTVALQVNPNMDIDQANAYIDTLIGFFTLRAYVALGLDMTSNLNDLSPEDVELTLFPNPASTYVQIQTGEQYPIKGIRVYSTDGKAVLDDQRVNNTLYRIDRGNLPPGIYIAQLIVESGIVHRQIIFN
jgi:acetyl esterase/lipase